MIAIQSEEPLQACADCDNYTQQSALIEKPDGRKICSKCQGQIECLTASKRQLDFFGQDSLFE